MPVTDVAAEYDADADVDARTTRRRGDDLTDVGDDLTDVGDNTDLSLGLPEFFLPVYRYCEERYKLLTVL